MASLDEAFDAFCSLPVDEVKPSVQRQFCSGCERIEANCICAALVRPKLKSK